MAGSGQHHAREEQADAVLLLAIRQEVEEALQPCMRKIDAMSDRLAAGDTAFALLRQQQEQQTARCLQHREGTDRLSKRREMHPLLLVAISTVVAALSSLTLSWWLSGITAQAAHQAATGAP
jgi:hypothetical protein